MNIIAAVDKNWGIGINGKLLISIPEDMKFFKDITMGSIVIMGRKTLESFPDKKPLKNRTNIVLTTDKEYKEEGFKVIHSVPELLTFIQMYDSEKVNVIGGGLVYNQLIPYCDTAYITYMDCEFQADTFMANLDVNKEWSMVEVSDEQAYYDITYFFRKYKRDIGIGV